MSAPFTWSFRVVPPTDLGADRIDGAENRHVKCAEPDGRRDVDGEKQRQHRETELVRFSLCLDKADARCGSGGGRPIQLADAVVPETSYTQTQPVRLTLNKSGSYYLLVNVNYYGQGGLKEQDYTNNVLAVPFTFNLTPADLKPTKITLTSTTITTNAPNPTIDLSWTVANIGTGPTTPRQWRDLVYVSAKPVLDDTAQPFYQSSPYDQTVPPEAAIQCPLAPSVCH